MIRVLLLMTPFLLNAESLKDLIALATTNNDLVISKQYSEQSRSKELASKKSAYFPTIDVGGFYKRDDSPSPFQAGDTLSGFVKVGFDLYDGGKRSSLQNQAKELLKSSAYDSKAYKKSLALQITEDFFNVKSLESLLASREEAQISLKAQLERISRFYDANMATKDEIDRVQSDFDTNVYNMESIKFQILSLKSALELKVGKSVSNLENSSFKKVISSEYETLDATKALISQNSSIKYAAASIDSFYSPRVRVEDTFSLYSYNRENPQVALLDNQNALLLTLNFRLFDYGEIEKNKEAVLLNAQALNSQINYQTKKQKMEHELAKAGITTANVRITSAKSALNAATSAFVTIEKKYNAGIVDYIVYLESLTKKTNSKALYESGLYELEIAYARLYYFEAKDIKEELEQ